MQDESEAINKYVNSEDFIGLGFYLYGFFLDLIDRYNIPPHLQNKITTFLSALNKEEISDAGKRLYQFYEELLREDEKESGAGIFYYFWLIIVILYLLSRL